MGEPSAILQHAADSKLFKSFPLHNRRRLLVYPACLSREDKNLAHDTAGESASAVVTANQNGCSDLIRDLAAALPNYYRRGLVRLPEAIPKPLNQLASMDAQRRVDLVEAMITWRLVDELMRHEGIDDGEFEVDYEMQFKPTKKLIQWVGRLADWPSVMLQACHSQENTDVNATVPVLTDVNNLSPEQHKLWVDFQAAWSWNRSGHLNYWQRLINLIEGVAWQIRWIRRTRGDPGQYVEKLQAFAYQHGLSEFWKQMEGSVNIAASRNKDAMVALLHCVTISPLILFKWSRAASPPPVQCLLYCSLVDDRDKPSVLQNVERSAWSLLSGVAAGAFSASTGLGLFLQGNHDDFEAAANSLDQTPWFDATVRLKPPRGSQNASIEVSPEVDVAEKAAAPVPEDLTASTSGSIDQPQAKSYVLDASVLKAVLEADMDLAASLQELPATRPMLRNILMRKYSRRLYFIVMILLSVLLIHCW